MEVSKAKLYVWVVAKIMTTMYYHDIDNGPDEFDFEIGGVFSSLEEAEEYVDTKVAEAVRCEDILEDIAGADTRELVRIAHKYKPCALTNGLEERMHKRQIDHGHLVYDDRISLKRFVLVLFKCEAASANAVGIVGNTLTTEHPVDCERLASCGLGYPLGRTTRGGCDQDREPLLFEV